MQNRMEPNPPGFPMFVMGMLACMALTVPLVAACYASTHLILYPMLSTKWVSGLFAAVVLPLAALTYWKHNREERLLPILILAGWAIGLLLGSIVAGG